MRPLSPFTYLLRHRRGTLLLASLIALVTTGMVAIVGMAQPIVDHTARVYVGFLSHFGLAYPAHELELDPAVVSQARTHQDVERVIPENGSGLVINVPSFVVGSSSLVLGIRQDDVQAVLDTCGLRLREGRRLRPNTNEFLVSVEFADALGLSLGDVIGRSIDGQHYPNIEVPMVLVGILESAPSVPHSARAQVAIASYEYLASHEMYSPRQSGLLVVPRLGRKEAVDTWLETTIASPHTRIETGPRRTARVERSQQMLRLALGVVDALVAVVVALVAGAITQVALVRRLADLGILNAIGHRRDALIRRLVLETAIVAGTGFLTGLCVGWLILYGAKTAFYEPRGVFLDTRSLAPLWFAVPIPVAVTAFAWLSALRLFQRSDVVTILDRRNTSGEARGERRATRSSCDPLSSLTFYRRHIRRSSVLVAAMAAMVVGVAFPVFFFMPMLEAQKPFYLNYLRYVTRVEPNGSVNVEPGVARQIGTHPAVARAIRVQPIEMVIRIPPVASNQVPLYGCYEGDMKALMELLGLELEDGRLPRARSNEVVLSASLAMNRGLDIGDTVGRPANEQDAIPSPLVVVGILSPGHVSLGFASLEYMENHELYASRPIHLFVVPVEGRKAELDEWLEEQITSSRTRVETYAEARTEFRAARRGFLGLLAAVECIIALVAALALATLNHVFFAQRRGEFGILHAVGRSRPWLVLRTTKETTTIVATAWLIGAVVCLAGLVAAQAGVFAPAGVPLNLADGTPWLFTLPIPATVVVVSTAFVAHTLNKLDPVSIIERRA